MTLPDLWPRVRTPSVELANLPVRLFYSFESPMCTR